MTTLTITISDYALDQLHMYANSRGISTSRAIERWIYQHRCVNQQIDGQLSMF